MHIIIISLLWIIARPSALRATETIINRPVVSVRARTRTPADHGNRCFVHSSRYFRRTDRVTFRVLKITLLAYTTISCPPCPYMAKVNPKVWVNAPRQDFAPPRPVQFFSYRGFVATSRCKRGLRNSTVPYCGGVNYNRHRLTDRMSSCTPPLVLRREKPGCFQTYFVIPSIFGDIIIRVVQSTDHRHGLAVIKTSSFTYSRAVYTVLSLRRCHTAIGILIF
jgi:hypothetical protein